MFNSLRRHQHLARNGARGQASKSPEPPQCGLVMSRRSSSQSTTGLVGRIQALASSRRLTPCRGELLPPTRAPAPIQHLFFRPEERCWFIGDHDVRGEEYLLGFVQRRQAFKTGQTGARTHRGYLPVRPGKLANGLPPLAVPSPSSAIAAYQGVQNSETRTGTLCLLAAKAVPWHQASGYRSRPKRPAFFVEETLASAPCTAD